MDEEGGGRNGAEGRRQKRGVRQGRNETIAAPRGGKRRGEEEGGHPQEGGEER